MRTIDWYFARPLHVQLWIAVAILGPIILIV